MQETETITSRKEARLAGESLYYTGKPCRKGHDSPRYVSSGQCVECKRRQPVPETDPEYIFASKIQDIISKVFNS